MATKKIVARSTDGVELTFTKTVKMWQAGETYKIGYLNARHLIAQSQRLKENGFLDLSKVDFKAMQLEAPAKK